jgi:hypothetical protein
MWWKLHGVQRHNYKRGNGHILSAVEKQLINRPAPEVTRSERRKTMNPLTIYKIRKLESCRDYPYFFRDAQELTIVTGVLFC